MQIDDFARFYESKTDDDLLRLEMDSAQLSSEANIALKNELVRRRIGAERINKFRELEQHRRDELARDPGRLFVLSRLGIGRMRFGKGDYVRSSEARMERFRTTVFLVFLWFPLIPRGTYLIERPRRFLSNQFRVLAKLPLDWGQVLRVWIFCGIILLAVIWMITVLMHRV